MRDVMITGRDRSAILNKTELPVRRKEAVNINKLGAELGEVDTKGRKYKAEAVRKRGPNAALQAIWNAIPKEGMTGA